MLQHHFGGKPSGSNPLVTGYNSDDEDDDDDSGKVNFFSMNEEKKETNRTDASGSIDSSSSNLLGVSSSKGSTTISRLNSESNSQNPRTALEAAPVEEATPETTDPDPFVQDQPLVFNSSKSSYGAGYHLPNYQHRMYNPAYDASASSSSSSHGTSYTDPSGAAVADSTQEQLDVGASQASGSMQYYNQPYQEGSEGGDSSQSGLTAQATGSQENFIHDEGVRDIFISFHYSFEINP